MQERLSSKIQNLLKWLIPVLIIFAIFYAISENKEKSVIIIPEDKSEKEILEDLNNRGYISNSLSYFIAKIALELGFDIETGGFYLSEKMGPFSLLAALASPDYKYVAIVEGMRKEQIAEVLAEKLNWNEEKKKEFALADPICSFTGGEGYYFPGRYLVHKDDSVEKIREQMENKLNETLEEITESTESQTDDILNVNQILTIASLIQREAAGKQDMKLISGIIWNRLFREMPLQIDATLQYVKGNDENGWWPMVKSDDKYIESPYNTYQFEGLPPGPISNPGKAAIEAALNPINTKCLFYLHDKNRNIHCTTTYESHKKNVSYYLK